jgi:ABC-type lipoprotein export system ATPase subunit
MSLSDTATQRPGASVSSNGNGRLGAPVVIAGRDLRKTYGEGESAVEAVRGVDIELHPGEITVLVGPSGSGKSSLLHLLSGLDTPTSGAVSFDGRTLSEMSEKELARWRAQQVGFVLQRNNLIPTLTIEENVAAPLILAGHSRAEAIERAREMLTVVGLGGRTGHWPAQVSGGEAARAAVARACAGKPSVIFADEPTGALDSENSRAVLELFTRLVRKAGVAALVVTHDPMVADAGDRVLRLVDGRIAGEERHA